MDATRFDALSRMFGEHASRRGVGGRVLTAVGLGMLPASGLAKKNRKQLRVNQFGCVSVGGKCRGKGGNCCSGICDGKKPKKDKKDKSDCLAHNERGCQVGQQIDICGGPASTCVTVTNATGSCATTTGKGAYCAALFGCAPCRKDTDCERFCGEGAACIPCAGPCANQGGTLCAGTGLTGCAFP